MWVVQCTATAAAGYFAGDAEDHGQNPGPSGASTDQRHAHASDQIWPRAEPAAAAGQHALCHTSTRHQGAAPLLLFNPKQVL